MFSVKSAGSSSPAGVAPQSATTSTPKPSETNGAGENQSKPTVRETKSSQQLANAKKEEFGLSLINKTLNNVLDGAKQLGETIIKDAKDFHQRSLKADHTDQPASEDLNPERFLQPGLAKYSPISRSLSLSSIELKRGDTSGAIDMWKAEKQVDEAREQLLKLNDLLVKNLPKPDEAMADTTKPVKKPQ